MGQTLVFISFGAWRVQSPKRAAPFGLRMMAYDPFIGRPCYPITAWLPATLADVLFAVRISGRGTRRRDRGFTICSAQRHSDS